LVQPDGWAELLVFVQDRTATRRWIAAGRASTAALPELTTKMRRTMAAATMVLMLSLQKKGT
jgi:hypothetical protein